MKMVEEDPCSGGEPEGFARCMDCRRVYPIQRTKDDQLRPIGTGGTCLCGSTDFEPYTENEEFLD